MEDSSSILTPTLFQRAQANGKYSALLTAKVKTVNLLAPGATVAVAAERPEPELVECHGPAPDIYSAEINYWLFQVAIDLLEHRPEIELVYVHTTDFPMHAWRPHDERSIGDLAVGVGAAVDVGLDVAEEPDGVAFAGEAVGALVARRSTIGLGTCRSVASR